MFRKRFQHVHFVGIGGIGHERHRRGAAEPRLHGLRLGPRSARRSPSRLRGAGRRACSRATRAENVGAPHVVVISTAVQADNPEVRRGAPPQHPRDPARRDAGRADAAQVRRSRSRAATARPRPPRWSPSCSTAAGSIPTVVVGGEARRRWARARGSARASSWWSRPTSRDRSFLKLSPTLAVVTNIDREHLDPTATSPTSRRPSSTSSTRCRSTAAPCSASTTPPCRRSCRASSGASSPTASRREADVSARDLDARGHRLAATRAIAPRRAARRRSRSRVPGRHNVVERARRGRGRRSTSSVPFEAIRAGLAAFSGVERRFQVRGEASGVTVIDDYGHHPTEIRATLETLRLRAGERAHARALPAAPLHAHAGAVGRVLRAPSTTPTCCC